MSKRYNSGKFSKRNYYKKNAYKFGSRKKYRVSDQKKAPMWMVRQLSARITRPETKYIDQNFLNEFFGNESTGPVKIYSFANIIQGLDRDNRIGNKIRLKSVSYKSIPKLQTNESSHMRFVLVLYPMAATTIPPISTILQDGSASDDDNVISQYTKQGLIRYTILKDFRFPLIINNSNEKMVSCVYTFPGRGLEVGYEDATAGSIISNTVLLYAVSSAGSVATQPVALSTRIRTTFWDA